MWDSAKKVEELLMVTEAFNDMQEEEVVEKMCLRKWKEYECDLLTAICPGLFKRI